MTRTARRTTFYVLLGLFFVLGALVVLYAEGWRFDFATGRPEKVGAVFVRSFPQNASITLNGKPVSNEAGILSHGTLISDLYPRTYTLALKAPGYDAWHENAAVLPTLVTEFKDAVLVPAHGMPMATATAATFVPVMRYGTILAASPDLTSIVAQNAATGAYRSFDIPQATSTRLVPPSGAQAVAFDPTNLQTVAWSKPASATAHTSAIFYRTDPSAAPVKSSSTFPGTTVALTWITPAELGVLQNDGKLFLYHTDTGSEEKIADDVTHFAATSDGSLIAALERNGLEIFSYTDSQTYHRFNLPNAGAATGLAWYKNMDHLFIVFPDHVAFLALDDLGLANVTTVANGTDALYDPGANALYLLNPSGAPTSYAFPD